MSYEKGTRSVLRQLMMDFVDFVSPTICNVETQRVSQSLKRHHEGKKPIGEFAPTNHLQRRAIFTAAILPCVTR